MEKTSTFRPSAAAFLLMMAMALTTTALSFFVTPVCDELAIGRGSFTIYYSLMTATGAGAATILGQYINKKGVRPVLLISGFWCCGGLLLFSVSSSLWMFYLAAAAMGIFGTSCVNLCANVIVQTSYSSQRASQLLGFVMAGSGVGGMVISFFLPWVIQTMGWRFGYRMLAALWLGLVGAAFLLLGRQETSGSVGHRNTPADGMTRAQALKSPKLYLLCAVILIMSACCGIQQQIPALLGGMGIETAQIGAMVSFFTAMLAVGKILQGVLYSKAGLIRGSYIMVCVFAVSFLLIPIRQIIYPALVTLAFGMGVVTTLMPLIARFAFGAREFASIWSILATASSAGSFAATPLWGMVYDATRTYAPAMTASFVGLAIALGLMVICFRETKRS